MDSIYKNFSMGWIIKFDTISEPVIISEKLSGLGTKLYLYTVKDETLIFLYKIADQFSSISEIDIGDEKLFPVNKKPFSGWYFERLLQLNQRDMISLFLKKDGVKRAIIENDFTLRVLTWYTDSFDLVPESIYTADLKIDSNFDYFQTAICRLNYNIIPILIMKKVHPYCNNSDEFIKEFIQSPRSKKILLWELDKESENYEKTIALSPMIKDYYEKWK